MEKVLAYQCPRCECPAFYMNGKRKDYVNGTEINRLMMDQIIKDRGMDVGGYIKCQTCYFPFTTGVLYLKNIVEFDK